jgi:hypothetical protein
MSRQYLLSGLVDGVKCFNLFWQWLRFHTLEFALYTFSTAIIGCSGGPPALQPPELDPQGAASEAISLYDKNGDGVLSAEELKACPGLLVALKTYDKDEDGVISRDEIVARLRIFVDRKTALTGLVATVLLDNRPMVGATIRFVPEPYLGDGIKPAQGNAKKRGAAIMAVAPEDLPENQKKIRGLHYGTYRVEITHPEIEVPSKYNATTTLGFETQPGNPSVTFNLKSR